MNVWAEPHNFTFIHKSVSKEDIDLFLGPIEDNEQIIFFDDDWKMAHIMNHAKWFKSVGEARKNGWNKPPKQGFDLLMRKKGNMICILNKLDE